MPNTPDDFTELVDADIDRVDLVDKAANGLPFLLAKSADGSPAGLLGPDLVRGLIGKGAEPQAVEYEMGPVTMSGSPDALAHLIHKAGGRLVRDDITKDTMADDLDPTVILAEPDEKAPGSPDVPGSPAWEAVDAATARKWTAILSRAKTALGLLVERELAEPGDGDPDDYEKAMDLGDAACAIDYAISVLAPFAVDEQAEVDNVEALAAVGKALDGLPGPLEVIESLGQVRKAGRSLSAANERAIREAVESLTKVLASLPAAPDTQESGLSVAKKETDMPESGAVPETIIDTAAVEPAPVGKADGEGEGKAAMVAVYDAKGKLVGIVSPDEITPISGADAGEEAEAPAAEDPAAAADLEAAPAAAVGVPSDETVVKEAEPAEGAPAADDITKTTPENRTDDILKSSALRDMVKGLLDEHSAGQAAQLTKTGEAVVELADVVETLKGQVRTLEEQPAQPGVFANGAVPPPHMLRGQDKGDAAATIDMVKARELKNTLTTGSAREQNDAAIAMQESAIEALKAIHGRG
jgi:hypothetical protein